MSASRPTHSVSPRQVAAALGVSESSVKRWSDQGLMTTRRTAGGHRKLIVADVLRFVRERGFDIGRPELLGLPGHASLRGLAAAAPRLSGREEERDAPRLAPLRAPLKAALLAGEEDDVRGIVVGLFVGGLAVTGLCDHVLAPVLRDLGDGWAAGTVCVFQEHRAISLVHRAIHALTDLLPPRPRRRGAALVATPSGDPYTVGMAFADLVLRERGFRVGALGPDTPPEALVDAILAERPRLIALGLHGSIDPSAWTGTYAPAATAARAVGAALLLGGPAATPELAADLPGAELCADMHALAATCDRLA